MAKNAKNDPIFIDQTLKTPYFLIFNVLLPFQLQKSRKKYPPLKPLVKLLCDSASLLDVSSCSSPRSLSSSDMPGCSEDPRTSTRSMPGFPSSDRVQSYVNHAPPPRRTSRTAVKYNVVSGTIIEYIALRPICVNFLTHQRADQCQAPPWAMPWT